MGAYSLEFPSCLYLVYFQGDRDVHGGGVRVVRALRLVDVVVGMHRALGA